MADGVKVSRGNPRASSVGEEEDVDEIRYRSTSKIDALDIVDIEDCGIVLDCSSPGDSFEPQDPCDNLHLNFYNVMGQEDKFRQEDGKRIDRGGTGRIVFTTIDETTIEKIEYDRQPTDEDNPVFDKEWDVSNFEPAKRHEVFIPVGPDVLYAFRVTVSVEGCEETNTSGIYYFSTGDTIVLEEESLIAVYETQIISSIVETTKISDIGSAQYAGMSDRFTYANLLVTTPIESTVIPTGSIINYTTFESNFSTTYTIS